MTLYYIIEDYTIHNVMQHYTTLYKAIRYYTMLIIPSQRRRAPFRALARGKGTHFARLLTPGKRKALAKSKVHQ
jgi:hypothetical protein